MKVLFLEPGNYKDGPFTVTVSPDSVEKKTVFQFHDADRIEAYVESGKAILPCMIRKPAVQPAMIVTPHKPAVKAPIKRRGRKASA